jgi:PTS system nitrogen regulatory IIA component
MDLKIKDVAELLSVSETTVRRWLIDGKIPAYRLNHQYRFSRIEIENWMLRCKLNPHEEGGSPFEEHQIYPPLEQPKDEKTVSAQPSGPGTQQFALYRAIHQGDIFIDVPELNKEELIRSMTQRIAPKLRVDAEVLAEMLLDREKMMPTAFNHGIAVPHTRDSLHQGPFDCIFVVFPKAPIDYGALDGEPVHTLFFLFATSDKAHLHLLSKIAHLSSSERSLYFFRSHPDKRTILEYIKDWESRLNCPAE